MGHVRALTWDAPFLPILRGSGSWCRRHPPKRRPPSRPKCRGTREPESLTGAHGRNREHNQTGRGVWGICDAAPTPAARDSYPTVTATAVSTSALAIMSAAAAHSEATGARTSRSAPNGGSAWQAASRSTAPGVGTPSYPANVGILDTTIRATRGPDLSTRTATVQPEPPTRHACANTGRNNELANNSGPAWALAFVRSQLFARAVRFVLPITFVPRLENFFVSLSFARRCQRRQRVSELKNELKSRVLLFFRAGYPLGGDPREALR